MQFLFYCLFLLFVWKQGLTQNPVKPITHSVAWLGLELLPRSPKYWGLEVWASMPWARSVSLQLSWELFRVPATVHWFLLGQVSSVSHSLPTRPHYIITILGTKLWTHEHSGTYHTQPMPKPSHPLATNQPCQFVFISSTYSVLRLTGSTNSQKMISAM